MSLLKDFGAGMLESINGKNGTLMGNSIFNALGTALSANLVGGILGGKEGARSMRAGITNAELTGAQREQNAFNAEEAEKARQFSEMQRQTQYQTAVNDMTAAGLNPAMLYQGAGSAASPTPSPAAQGSAPQSNKISDIVTLLKGMSELKAIEAEVKNTESQTKINEIEAQHRDALLGSQIGLNKSNMEKNSQEIQKLIQDIAESKSRVELNGKEMEVKDAQIAVFGAQCTELEARAAYEDAQAFLASAQTWQIQQITPALVSLYQANAMLARSQTLTEAEQRFYLRKAGYAQQALNDWYYTQKDYVDSVQKPMGLADLQVHRNDAQASNTKARKTGYNYDYNTYRNENNARMWSSVAAIMGAGANLGNTYAGFQRNNIMNNHFQFLENMSIPANKRPGYVPIAFGFGM